MIRSQICINKNFQHEIVNIFLSIVCSICFGCSKNEVVLQGSKIVLVHSYLRVSQAAGQVNILIFLLKIKFSPCMPINFVKQGKCLFSDISRPVLLSTHNICLVEK